jgi:hypothetical protein
MQTTNRLKMGSLSQLRESMKQPEIKNVFVTPELAKLYLEKNTTNRPLRESVIKKYTQDIINGLWRSNTFELIMFNKNGELKNGQHRLNAIIRSGIGLKLQIVEGVDDDIFTVIDTGNTRTAGDIFAIKNIQNANGVSTMIKAYLQFKKGSSNIYKARAYSHAQLLEFYNQRPNFYQEVYKKSSRLYNAMNKVLKPGFIGSLYCLLSDIDIESADDFVNQLCTGDKMNPNIKLLRKKLYDDMTAKTKMTHSDKVALVFKTWNLIRKNEIVKLLKFDSIRDTFPKPI